MTVRKRPMRHNMEKSVFYVIYGERVSEDKADVRRVLRMGKKVSKITRISYQTGPTKATMTTVTELSDPKDV